MRIQLLMGTSALLFINWMPPEPAITSANEMRRQNDVKVSRVVGGAALKPMTPQPQFLRVRWEDTPEQGPAVTLEAMACLRHRREIALAYPRARGAGGRGEDCDLCSGRFPQPLGSKLSQFAPQSARGP
jgi:hypothetical protein